MKMQFLILLSLIILTSGFFSNAFAETNPQDGNTFLNYCKLSLTGLQGGHLSDQELIKSEVCTSYITGYVDAHNLETNGTSAQWFFCSSPKSNYGQYIRIFIKYMEQHPEKLHEDVKVLLFSSLTKAFPCD
jgi:hypothetical protein